MAVASILVGWAVGVVGIAIASEALDDMVDELDALDADLEDRITETEEERDRRLTRLQTVYDANLEAIEATETGERATLTAEAEARYQLAMHGPGGVMEQIANLEAARVIAVQHVEDEIAQLTETADLEQDERNRLMQAAKDRLVDVLANIDRRRQNLLENVDAALEEIAIRQGQLIADKELDLEQLIDLAEAGDLEAARKITQIEQTRDQMMEGVRDQAIIQMNEIGAQGRYALGKQVGESELEIARQVATNAALGFRRSGTPLMALRQTIRLLQEAEERKSGQITSHLTGAATELGARLAQLKSQATWDIEDVAAELLLFNQGLEQQKQDIELAFTHGYDNLMFTKKDILRQKDQDLVALDAEEKTARRESTDEIAGLVAADLAAQLAVTHKHDLLARDLTALGTSLETMTEAGFVAQYGSLLGAKGTLELSHTQELADITADLDERVRVMLQSLTTEQEDLAAASTLVTAEYGRRREEIGREKTRLEETRLAVQLTALFGGVESGLASARSLVTSASTILTPDWGGLGQAV